MPHIPGYNFAGPGTDLQEQLKKKQYPVNELDFWSLIHDFDYSIKNKSTLEADQEYLDRISNIPGPLPYVVARIFDIKGYFDYHTSELSDIFLRPERYQGKYASY